MKSVLAEPMEVGKASALGRDQKLLIALSARLRRLNTIVLGNLEVSLTFRPDCTLARVASGFTSMGQLAAQANLTLPTVSETFDGLVHRGLMDRRPNEVDHSAIVPRVTNAGAAAADAGDLALREVIETLTQNLSEGNRAELTRSLSVVYAAATKSFTGHVNSNARFYSASANRRTLVHQNIEERDGGHTWA